MASDNLSRGRAQGPESTSGDTQGLREDRARGRRPVPLPAAMAPVHGEYVAALEQAPVDTDTRRAYASRVRQYLVWLADADVDGDPLTDPSAIHGALRDYRAHLQVVAKRTPSTINTVLAAISDFYTRRGLGTPDVQRLDLPTAAPRALAPREAIRWLRTVERCLSPRDRVLALIPFYAGLRIGETVALNVDERSSLRAQGNDHRPRRQR